MSAVILKGKTDAGHAMEATFLPEIGMNMISFKTGNVELIDQTTKHEFEERRAGLGALIGPHFHRRLSKTMPVIPNENKFPHIEIVKKKGIEDPFSHGIARYAPWTINKVTEHSVSATLSGKSTWNDVPLALLEGQNFTMQFQASFSQNGLTIELSIVSDFDSLVGIHYYYRLPKSKGTVTSQVQDSMIEKSEKKPIPQEWKNERQQLHIALEDKQIDNTFYAYPNKLQGDILLSTEEYQLKTTYFSLNQENSWQLFHPANSSFVCIEPVSSQDPRHPNLTVSSLKVHLEVTPHA